MNNIFTFHRLKWILLAFSLLLPGGLHGQSAAPNAAEILTRAVKGYTNLNRYSALIYRRKLTVNHPPGAGNAASDYQTASGGDQVITVRLSGQYNLFVESDQYGYINQAGVGHPFLLAKTGRDTGRFTYLDSPDPKPAPLTDELLMVRLRGCLDLTSATVVESLLFGAVNTDEHETFDYQSAELKGEGTAVQL